MSETSWQPRVSVVVPMLNEAGFIEACLDGFAAQTYPAELFEVIVADGGSTDGSREAVETMRATRPWLRVVENPGRKAAAAFNVGVDSSTGEVVCLFSAHGVPSPGYLERSVEVLAETGAAGVGGKVHHLGTSRAARAVGLAMESPFGMGSLHRYASCRTEVDTISHPAYRREWLERVGPFDETLERNSDYELNWRLRQMGGTLVFDPTIHSIYRPRSSLRALGRQFWWYGAWKARVVRKHPQSRRLRHAAPPAAVAGALFAVSLAWWGPARRISALSAAAYMGILAEALARTRPWGHDADWRIFVAALPIMHGAWGAGYLAATIRDGVTR